MLFGETYSVYYEIVNALKCTVWVKSRALNVTVGCVYILFICGLFNSTVCSSDHTVLRFYM
jgi:hypothetical protein